MRQVNAVGAARALALAAGLVTAALANEPAPSPAKAAEPPLIATLKPGKYEPSSMAVGAEVDVARQRGEGLGLLRSETIEAHLAQIRQRLLGVSGLSDVPGRALISVNPGLAAYSTADGNIYIALGWVSNIESQDEMAAIVAHELAHVLLTHHGTDQVTEAHRSGQMLHEMWSNWKTAKEQKGTTNPPPAANQPKQPPKSDAVALAIDQLAMPAWNRKQESEADALGIDLLAKAGYNPVAMITILDKVADWESRTKASPAPAAGPAKQAAQPRPQPGAKPQSTRVAAKKEMKGALGGVANQQLAILSVKHPETKERASAIASYIDTHYAELAVPEPDEATWSRFRKQPELAEVMNNYEHAFTAHRLVRARRTRDAYNKAKLATAGTTASHAYPNWVFAKSATMLGRGNEARAALERTIAANNSNRLVFDEMIDYHEKRRELTQAIALADKAAAELGEGGASYPTRIRLYRKAGRTSDASNLVLTCTFKLPVWRDLCKQANLTPVFPARTFR